ncbi:MAG: hypothetical protein IPK95_05330 [Cellvibrionales bacterium]|jgi:hypothetical protein|nr:hypothetical protein [Cellvibrionales bacterium]
MRWLVLIAILVFVFAQITRMRPSRRDQQLQALRKAASVAGLTVRFWTSRNSGYSHRQLPESGFMYILPWPLKHDHAAPAWALWVNSHGEVLNIAGQPPELAQQYLASFRERFADAWGLLECNNAGVCLLWEERGEPADVQDIADALDLLRKNLDALPG